jgi:predicted GNAT superfamily acetyltransferase
MYGTDTGSPVHEAIGTDRFVVAWDLATDRTPLAASSLDERAWGATPVVSSLDAALPGAPAVRVEIPSDIHAVIAADRVAAAAWRTTTRRAFTHYLARGWRVVGVERDEHSVRYRLLRG